MAPGRIVRFEGFEFDLGNLELRRQERRLRLAPQLARLLAVLLQQPGELATREVLKQALWTEDTFVEFDQGLRFCIKRLRAVLGDDARHPRYIETVPKRGYRFIAPVSIDAPPQPLPARPAPAVEMHDSRARPTRRSTAAAAIAAAVGIAVAVFALARSDTPGASAPVRVAVLPFTDLSGDGSRAHISEGFVEALIAGLNRVNPGRLTVVARSSSARYSERDRDLPAIGRRLNVRYVVEGSVGTSGDRLRIAARLVDPRQRSALWSNTYERDTADVAALQDDVAAAIAHEVGAVLAGPPAARRPVDPRAHELYLRGRFFWNRRAPAELARAAALFREALAIDPQFARAHAGLSDAYMSSALGLHDRAAFAEALASADRAIALDGELSEAYVSRAHALSHLFRWEEAERAYRRAIELDPNYAPGRYLFSEWLSCHGRFADGIREAQLARDLDPVSAIATHALGVAHLYARDFPRAADLLAQALELDSLHGWSHDRLGQVYMAAGDAEKARASFARFTALDPRQVMQRWRVEARFGDASRAHAAIEEHARRDPTDVMSAAWGFAALGDNDAAFRWLDKAIEVGDYQVIFLAIDPRFDPIRADPRFIDRLHRIGLQPIARLTH